MTTPQTDELLDEVQAMLREREREGVRGLDPDDATDGLGRLSAEAGLVDGTGMIIQFEITRAVLRL